MKTNRILKARTGLAMLLAAGSFFIGAGNAAGQEGFAITADYFLKTDPKNAACYIMAGSQARMNQAQYNADKAVEETVNAMKEQLERAKAREDVNYVAGRRPNQARQEDEFFTYSEFIDGYNGGELNGKADYPKEFVGIGRLSFKTDERFSIAAVLKGKKDSIMYVRCFNKDGEIFFGEKGKRIDGEVIESDLVCKTLEYRFPNPEMYRIAFYLNGIEEKDKIGNIEVNILDK